MRAHFLFRTKIRPLTAPPEEYALIDMADNYDLQAESFRRRLLLSDCYSLIKFDTLGTHTWLLFKRETPKRPLPKTVIRISDVDWRRIGFPVKVERVDSVSVRVAFALPGSMKAREGFSPAILFFRLERKVDMDWRFKVEVRCEEGGAASVIKSQVPFGLGVLPAYMAEPGDSFQLPIEIPAKSGAGIRVEVDCSPKPDFNLSAF